MSLNLSTTKILLIWINDQSKFQVKNENEVNLQ
jgi:hypothetical protein